MQTKKDVSDVLEQYRSLSYKLENFGNFDRNRKEKCRNRSNLCVWQIKSSILLFTVFNDGTRKELLNLGGTVPVVYKSIDNISIIGSFLSEIWEYFLIVRHTDFIFTDNTYHIPICIWLMDTHPYNAPLAYVQPTADMQIKVSMYVDHNGKIYLPYLHDWNHVSCETFLIERCWAMRMLSRTDSRWLNNLSNRRVSLFFSLLKCRHHPIYWVSFK